MGNEKMKKITLLALALASCGLNASVDSAPGTAISFDTNPCTGADGTGGITDTIAIAETGNLTDVNVNLDITHTWRGDLQMHLSYTGGGGDVILAAGHGAGSADNYFAIFDSEAGTVCNDVTTCDGDETSCFDSGNRATCSPDGALTAFNGLASPGTWTITVCDAAAGDDGTLDLWGVTLTGDGNVPVELMNLEIE
jgi:subtilisin-like proprotein convertase family protein